MLVLSTQLCELLPLSPSLWFNSPPPLLPCVNNYTEYTYTVCKRGGGMEFWALINTCRKVPIQVNFFDDDILHCLLWFLFCTWLGWGSPAIGSLAGAPCHPEKEAADHTKLSGDFLKVSNLQIIERFLGQCQAIARGFTSRLPELFPRTRNIKTGKLTSVKARFQ